ncbi:FAD-binding protein [Metaclostridioides mangenotii]|uniref:FAD-binding protein n=1 Tax=Metaclostridioides mangenotii TaxID=1540 RepID=UPI00048536E6|nr:FAD-binding protein [Clostridioides mangenotii]
MNFGFFAGLTGNVVTHYDKGYLKARQERNLAIQTFPLAIVFCKCEQDVVNAVCWCQENNIFFRVRNGRHHYAGYSTGNNVLVIDSLSQ